MAGVKEIAEIIYKKYPYITKGQSRDIVENVFQQVEELAIYGNVRVPIGTFRIIEQKEREGRNPKTGEVITVPARKKLKFKPKKKED